MPKKISIFRICKESKLIKGTLDISYLFQKHKASLDQSWQKREYSITKKTSSFTEICLVQKVPIESYGKTPIQGLVQ